MTQERQGRSIDILARDLGPDSLVGSWFHRIDEGELEWLGLVVAEPQPGIYVVQLFDWGDRPYPTYQRVVPLHQMSTDAESEWRFYDTLEQMNAGYARWIDKKAAHA